MTENLAKEFRIALTEHLAREFSIALTENLTKECGIELRSVMTMLNGNVVARLNRLFACSLLAVIKLERCSEPDVQSTSIILATIVLDFLIKQEILRDLVDVFFYDGVKDGHMS